MPLKHTVEEIKLDNGIKGLLINVPDATVVNYCIGFMAAGTSYVNVSINQAPHILEHMISSGISERFKSRGEFSQEFSKNGAKKNAMTSNVRMKYIAESALMEWDRILDLMQSIISKPMLIEASLDSEKRTVKEELTMKLNDNTRLSGQLVKRAMGTFDVSDLNRIETISRVMLSDIESHYKVTHSAVNMRFILVGDLVSHKLEIIDKFQSIDIHVGDILPSIIYKAKKASAIKLFKDMPNLVYRIGISINRNMSSREYLAMKIVNLVLFATMHSRVFKEARRRGLCYYIGYYCGVEPSNYSDWQINGDVKKDNIIPLFQLIVDEIRSFLADGLAEDELRSIKQYLIGNYQMAGQTVNSLNEWYASSYFDQGKGDVVYSLEQYLGDVESITEKDVIDILAEFINEDTWCLGVVGNLSDDELYQYEKIISNIFDVAEEK